MRCLIETGSHIALCNCSVTACLYQPSHDPLEEEAGDHSVAKAHDCSDQCDVFFVQVDECNATTVTVLIVILHLPYCTVHAYAIYRIGCLLIVCFLYV